MAIGSKLLINIMGDISDIKAKTAETKGFFGELGQASKTFSMGSGASLTEVANSFKGLGTEIGKVGASMTKSLTLPIVAGLGAAVGAAVSFEDAFAGVKKTVDATDAEFDRLNDTILEMSRRIPLTANEIAGVMEAAGQLGIATPNLESFTEVMANLGVATNLSAEQAATSLARFANIVGTAPEQFENLGSTIVDLGNNFATTESEILDMAMSIAGTSVQMGMSEGDIFGISTALSSMGISAQRGGTAISKWLTQMQVASTVGYNGMKELEEQTGLTISELDYMAETNAKAFKELAMSLEMTPKKMKEVVKSGVELGKMADVSGIQVEDFAEMIKDDAAGALGVFLTGLTETNTEHATSIEMLADLGVNQERMRDTLLRAGSAQQLYADAIRVGNKAFEENTALQEEADLRYETAASQLQMMKNSMFDMANSIGKHMLPTFKEVNAFLADLANKISDMNPETVQKIVKALATLAVVGPALAIVGKGMKLIGGGLNTIVKAKGIMDKVKEFSKFSDASTGFTASASSVEGGWTRLNRTLMNVTTDKDGRMRGPDMKYITNDFKAYSSKLEMAGIETNKLGNLTSQMGKTMGKVAKNPFVVGGVLIALAGYLKKTYDSSERFRSGLEKLKGVFDKVVSVFKPVRDGLDTTQQGMDDMKEATDDSGGSITDWLLVIGGVAGVALSMTNPIGWAMAAVGSFTLAMKSWGDETKETVVEISEVEASLINMGLRMQDVILPIDTLTTESMPGLIASFDKAKGAFGEDGVIPVEQIEDQAERLKLLGLELTEYYDERRDLELEAQRNYYELLGAQDMKSAEDKREFTEGLNAYMKTETETVLNQIAELEKKAVENSGVLTDEEYTQREVLYEKLDQLALQRLTVEEVQNKATMGRLQDKLRTQGELTIAEEEKLTELINLEAQRRQEIIDFNTGTELVALEQSLETGYITREEYLERVAELTREDGLAMTKMQVDFLSEQMENLVGHDLEKIVEQQQFLKDKKELDSLEEDRNKGRLNSLISLTAKEVEELQRRTDEYWAQNKEIELTTSQLETVMELLSGDITQHIIETKDGFTLSGAAKDMLRDFESEFSETVSGYEKAGENAVDGLTKGAEKGKKGTNTAIKGITQGMLDKANSVLEIRSPSKAFTRIGEYTASGLAQGVENGRSNVLSRMGSLASSMLERAKGVLGIASPSREFAKVGGFVTEGLSGGIDDGSDSVVKSTEDMAARALSSMSGFENSMSKSVTKDVMMNYQQQNMAALQRQKNEGIARQQAMSSASQADLGVDYIQMIKAIRTAVSGMKFQLDDDGFVSLIDDRLREVVQ